MKRKIENKQENLLLSLKKLKDSSLRETHTIEKKKKESFTRKGKNRKKYYYFLTTVSCGNQKLIEIEKRKEEGEQSGR